MSAVAAACASAASVSQSMRSRATRQHTAACHSRGAVSSHAASHAQQGNQAAHCCALQQYWCADITSRLGDINKGAACWDDRKASSSTGPALPGQKRTGQDSKEREDGQSKGAHLPQRPP